MTVATTSGHGPGVVPRIAGRFARSGNPRSILMMNWTLVMERNRMRVGLENEGFLLNS